MPSNIEVKIRISNPADLRSLITSSGARHAGKLEQIDTFFRGGKRLKLREFGSNQTAELIAYDRPDLEGLRTSDYRLCKIDNASELKETLAFGLGTLRTVEKSRELFLLRRTRIHLDDVKGLGHFLELEVVLGPEDDVAGGEQEAAEILQLLQVDENPRIGGSYYDLLETAR